VSERVKRPYERPTLEAREIFGAEAVSASCCKVTNPTCRQGLRTSLGKSTRTSATS
jgi:hypothetical protein